MNPALRIEIRKKHLNSPITCLKIVGSLIFAGEGPFIRVYSTAWSEDLQWTFCGSYQIFESVNVHLLKTGLDKSNSLKLCAIGGKSFRVLEIQLPPLKFSLKLVSPIFTFQDWIWDAKWLSEDQIVFVLAKNYIVLWNSKENKSVTKIQCETNCILYCGCFISNCWSNGIVMSGTVFREVLIWSPTCIDLDNSSPVMHRLIGHEGVLFFIKYNEALKKLCTSSDDRSVHIWDHQLNSNINYGGNLTIDIWKSSKFMLVCKLFGHEARVCKSLIISNSCLSAGEDSMLCMWKCDSLTSHYKLAKKISCHAGSAIRSLVVNNENTFTVTGGDDGGIKIWPLLPQIINDEEANMLILNSEYGNDKESAREVKLLDENHILIFTNFGRLLCFNLKTRKINVWFEGINAKSESVLSVDLFSDHTLIAFGDVYGKITILKTYYADDNETLNFSTLCQFESCKSKVFTVTWVQPYSLLSCGANGHMKLWSIEDMIFSRESVKLFAEFELPFCRQRWVSSAKLINQFKTRLICGSRGGSVYVYELSSAIPNQIITSSQLFSKLHGTHGVSSIYSFGNSVYTTGRDGIMSLFEINSNGLQLMNKIRISGCPKWISGVFAKNEDLIVYGFHDDRFVIWSEMNQSILTEIRCGGGHRSWDIKFQNTFFTFVYLKEGDIGVSSKDLKYSLPICLKRGNHIRQITIVKYLFTEGFKSYFATGSEDNSIRIWSTNLANFSENISLEHCLRSHISSIKTIGICNFKISEPKCKEFMMVTAGGRAQIICWKLTLCIDDGSDFKKYELKVQYLMSYLLNPIPKLRKPWTDQSFTVDPEIRFMDLAVWRLKNDDFSTKKSIFITAVACSDGYIRYYGCNLESNQITFWTQHRPHGLHCILKTCYAKHRQRPILITAATDGQVAIIDLNEVEEKVWSLESLINSSEVPSCKNFDQENQDLEILVEKSVVMTFQHHQSGITCLAVEVNIDSMENTKLVVATGGDDTALHVTEIVFELSSQQILMNKFKVYSVPVAHDAQITGIGILSKNVIVTTSVDQKIRVWTVEEGINLVSSSFSNVADASSMIVWSERCNELTKNHLCIVGKSIGMYELLENPNR